MGNHEIPCDFCGEDTRGLSGVKGCDTQEQAYHCSNYVPKVKQWTVGLCQVNEIKTWIETYRHSGKVERTHTVPTIQRYSNAEHVCNAMMIAIELCRLAEMSSDKVIRSLLVHDVEEVYTGDFPANIKHHKKLKKALSKVEMEWANSNIPLHHNNTELSDTEYQIAKIADSLELVYFCIDEALMGNRTKPLINMCHRVHEILSEKVDKLDNRNITMMTDNILNQLSDIIKERK